MPPALPSRLSVAVVAVVASTVLMSAGCGPGDDASTGGRITTSASPAAATSAAASPTPTGKQRPTLKGSPPAASLAAGLLPAREVPLDASGRPWTTTGEWHGASVHRTSRCERAPLLLISATEVQQRRYDNGGPGGVVDTVAAFADGASARQAYAVLEAWARGCDDTLREQGREPIRTPAGFDDVATRTSPAGWALLFYGPLRGDPDAAHIEAQVAVVHQDMLSWLAYRTVGQDYDYEPGQAPPERAARPMAQRLRVVS